MAGRWMVIHPVGERGRCADAGRRHPRHNGRRGGGRHPPLDRGALRMSGWQPSGYTPVRPLGAGASGTVVLATHDPTGTPVAIKFLVDDLGDDASFRAAFRDEARLLGEIDDPHVCRLYEYIESADGAA